MVEPLRSTLVVEFDYTRSLGGLGSAVATALHERTLLGTRISDGRVIVPALEVDPITFAMLDASALVPVGPAGTVRSWTWVSEPVAGQPFSEPFAFALIQLDGADTAMLHAVAVPEGGIATGDRVRARWRDERTGSITDLVFEPVGSPTGDAGTAADSATDPITVRRAPIRLDYDYQASPEESRFYRAIAHGRLVGQRCPVCAKVYIPPRGACPVDGVPTHDEVELADTGTVATFSVINVPFPGQRLTPPYVSAYILLDGADIPILHLVNGIDADQVRMGLRVRAKWLPREQWGTSFENIAWFEPTGQPDAPYETYREHL